ACGRSGTNRDPARGALSPAGRSGAPGKVGAGGRSSAAVVGGRLSGRGASMGHLGSVGGCFNDTSSRCRDPDPGRSGRGAGPSGMASHAVNLARPTSCRVISPPPRADGHGRTAGGPWAVRGMELLRDTLYVVYARL